MKIEYAPNPLYTKVILDEHEQEIFKWKIRLKEYEEMVYSAYHTLTHHDWWNSLIAKNGEAKPVRTLQDTIDEAVKELHPDYWMDEEDGKQTKMEERVEMLFKLHMDDLVGYHVGDCTCVPCSCSKCWAENLLGIDTIKGLGKHEASKINSAFGRQNEKTLDEVIASLEDYEPKPFEANPAFKNWTKEDHDKHIPRWREEGKRAHIWLINYRNTHFKD